MVAHAVTFEVRTDYTVCNVTAVESSYD